MRVVLADDATLFREGLARILSEAGFAVSGQAGDAQGLLRLVRALLKDRISDLAEFAEAVRRVGAGGSVIDPEVVSQLLGRARAPSPLEELTPREREVLALIAEGRSNQAICSKLYVSPKTLDTHVHSIFRKLNCGRPPTTTAGCSPFSHICL